MKTNTRPPVEIYDVLHEAETFKGVKLPESIEKWWALETALNETPQCQKCSDKGKGVCDTDGSIICPTFNTVKLVTEATYE